MKNINKVVLYIICVLLFSLYSCVEKNNTIKVINSEDKKLVNISDLFKTVDLLILETTDVSLIGLQIEKLEFFNDRIYILNRMHSHCNILCFSIGGEFLFKIDQIGYGPQEYTYLADFFIDKIKRQIILYVDNNKFLFFDLNGKFLEQIKTDDEYFVRQIIPANDSTCFAYNNAALPPQGYNLLELDSRTFKIRNKSKIDEPIMNIGFSPLTSSSGQVLFYNTNDTIYNITDLNNKSAEYYIDWGKKQKEYKKTLRWDNENTEKMVAAFNNGNINFVSAMFENTTWIIIPFLRQGSINSRESAFLLYDKRNDRVYNSDNINFDMLNVGKIMNIQVVACEEEKIFMLMKDEFIEKNDDLIHKIEQSEYINDKKKELKQRKSFDNPILFILE